MKNAKWIALVCGAALIGASAILAAPSSVTRLMAPEAEKALQTMIEKNLVTDSMKSDLFNGKIPPTMTAGILRGALMSALSSATASPAQKQAAQNAMGILEGLSKSTQASLATAAVGMNTSTKVNLAEIGKAEQRSFVDPDKNAVEAILERQKIKQDLDPVVVKEAIAALDEKDTITGPGMISCQGKIEGKESGFPTQSAENALRIAVETKKLGGGCQNYVKAVGKVLNLSAAAAQATASALVQKCGIYASEFSSCVASR